MTEIGVSNDQSHFFGMFGKVIEETDIGYKVKLDGMTSTIYFLKEEVETFE